MVVWLCWLVQEVDFYLIVGGQCVVGYGGDQVLWFVVVGQYFGVEQVVVEEDGCYCVLFGWVWCGRYVEYYFVGQMVFVGQCVQIECGNVVIVCDDVLGVGYCFEVVEQYYVFVGLWQQCLFYLQ